MYALTLPKSMPWGKTKEIVTKYLGTAEVDGTAIQKANEFQAYLIRAFADLPRHDIAYQHGQRELTHLYCVILLLGHLQSLEVTLASPDVNAFTEVCDAYAVNPIQVSDGVMAKVVPNQQQEFIDMLLSMDMRLEVSVPELFDYVNVRAEAGDVEAKRLVTEVVMP